MEKGLINIMQKELLKNYYIWGLADNNAYLFDRWFEREDWNCVLLEANGLFYDVTNLVGVEEG